MNSIKQIFFNQCEKLVHQIFTDQSVFSTINYACNAIACGYHLSKKCINKCCEKINGTKQSVSKFNEAYRLHKKLSKRNKPLGKYMNCLKRFVLNIKINNCLLVLPYRSKLQLKDWYSKIEQPTIESKREIAKTAGITVKEVNRWIRNKRRSSTRKINEVRHNSTLALESYYLFNAKYLNKESKDMQDLMYVTKLSSIQVQRWFANKRRADNISFQNYKVGKKM